MKKVFLCFAIWASIFLSACSSNLGQQTADPKQEARDSVIEKWETAQGELGTTKFIEDTYKQYPDDEVISNIYFYSIAKEQYGYYISLGKSKYLDQAKEYAAKIDPHYSGEYATEIHDFVDSLLQVSAEEKEDLYESAKPQEDKYSSLTNREKKQICEYIQGRYDYYDSINGGYSGDKYSDKIMQEAADKYGLTVTQIEIIWMNMYDYD